MMALIAPHHAQAALQVAGHLDQTAGAPHPSSRARAEKLGDQPFSLPADFRGSRDHPLCERGRPGRATTQPGDHREFDLSGRREHVLDDVATCFVVAPVVLHDVCGMDRVVERR